MLSQKLSGMKFLLKLLIFLMGALLLIGCRQHSSSSWDPVEAYPSARTNQLVGFQGRLGTDASVPFMACNPVYDHASGVIKLGPGQQGALSFLAFHPVDVEVSLEGRLLEGKANSVIIELNEQAIDEVVLTNQWKLLKFTLPAYKVRQGRNVLGFRCDKKTEWHEASFISDLPQPLAGKGDAGPLLKLPFGAVLDYPVRDLRSSVLSVDVQPWTQPGAPSLEDWRLRLTLQDNTGKELEQWTIQEFGQPELQLPELPGYGILTLSLEGPDLLPGQLGLLLGGQALETPPDSPRQTPREGAHPPAAPPNVILFVIDTLRADYLQPYGYPLPTSPHLQEFRKDAILYEDCIAPAPWTKPSVATLITGLPPSEHTVIDFADRLPDQLHTLAERLQEGGYFCRAVVNNGLLDALFGYGQGYQDYYRVKDGTLGTTQVEWTLDRMKDRQSPFFLHLHLLDPHTPYRPSEVNREKMFEAFELTLEPGEWGATGIEVDEVFGLNRAAGKGIDLARKTKIVQALYCGGIADADDGFGLLVSWLKENNLYDDSLIIVTSDHGEEMMDHGSVGHLTSVYQELIRVPLLVKFPGNKEAGTSVRGLRELRQIVPTILETALGSQALEESMRTLQEPAPYPIFYGADVGRDATLVNQGERDYHVSVEGVRLEEMALARYYSSTRQFGPLVLYNLQTDPQERNNLLWQQPALSLYLSSLLKGNQPPQESSKVGEAREQELREILRSLQYLK